MSLSLRDRLFVAQAALGRSVIAINPEAVREAASKDSPLLMVGLKDTGSIPQWLVDSLQALRHHLILTIDRMSDLGRSIDTDLVNPLTYRPMTDSTSGGAINVLKGINDCCVGTDGGGSVLAPALAINLYAIMAKGVGLYAGSGQSTDGMDFSADLGFYRQVVRCCAKSSRIFSWFFANAGPAESVDID